MTGQRKDIHDSLFDEIEGRITTLRAGAPTSSQEVGAWSQEDVNRELAKLENDRELLLAHWKTEDGLVAATSPARARACGQPQPCPHVLDIAERYRYV